MTPEDQIDLSRISKKLDTDPEVRKYMEGDNSEINKKNYFNEKCNEILLQEVDEKFDFYQRMESNQSVKNMIFKLLYENYQLKN